MKKILILFGILIFGLTNAQQLLTIPTDELNGEIGDTIAKWQRYNWIVSSTSTETNSTYVIQPGFNPEQSDVVNIILAGGNTSNYPFFLRISDSLFFASDIPDDIGGNLYDIQGRYTSELLTWANFLDVDHEVYYQSNIDFYFVLASKADGTLMTLSEANQIRIDNSYVASVVTLPFIKAINNSFIYKRTDYNTWENNPF